MPDIKQFIKKRIGFHELVMIAQSFVMAAIIVAVNRAFFPTYTETTILALTAAFGGIQLSYKKTINSVFSKVVMCLLGCVVSFAFALLFPANLFVYLISIVVTCILIYIFNKGEFNIFPLIVVTVIYFSVLAPGKGPRLDLALAVIPIFIEVIIGAVSAALVALVVHMLPSERIRDSVQNDPEHKLDLKPSFAHLKDFSRDIDPRFYMAFAAVLVGCVVYMIAGHLFEIEYPWIIFDSIIIVSQTTLDETYSKSKDRIQGTLLGVAVGLGGFLLFGHLPFAIWIVPALLALGVLLDFLVFGEYVNVTIVVAFLLLIEPTTSMSFSYTLDRVASTILAVLITLLVYKVSDWAVNRLKIAH